MKTTSIVREKLKIDHPPVISGKYTDASVFLLISEETNTKIIFILRSQFITHANEIAFPGGVIEKHDRSLIGTAYRETYEEINVSENNITFLGRLGDHVTASGTRVTPYIGSVSSNVKSKIKSAEVTEIFHVPLKVLLEQNYNDRPPVSVKNDKKITDYFMFDNHVVWGLTGRILCDFFNRCFGQTHRFDRIVES